MKLLRPRFKGRLVRASLAAWTLLAVVSAVATAGSLESIAIDNFARVNANYFRGAQPLGHDYKDLATAGVKSVINLTSDDARADEPSMVAAAGMQYFQIPMTTHAGPTPDQIDRFLTIVNDPANQPTYVHCVGGRHRTGVMTAVYRMDHDQWSAARAFAEMKNFKFGPDFLHSELKQFVFAYHADPPDAPAVHLQAQ